MHFAMALLRSEKKTNEDFTDASFYAHVLRHCGGGPSLWKKGGRGEEVLRVVFGGWLHVRHRGVFFRRYNQGVIF